MRLLACLAVLLAVSQIASASLISIDLADDADGAVNCTPVTTFDTTTEDNQTVYVANVVGDQFWGPGHVGGTLTTDTAMDPTLRIRNAIDNETDFTWTSYTVNVSLNRQFTITGAAIYDPLGGDIATTAPTETAGLWTGSVTYTGISIPYGTTFEYGYVIAFSGALNYSLTQEMVPVPEPGTVAMLAVGAAALIVHRKARARRAA